MIIPESELPKRIAENKHIYYDHLDIHWAISLHKNLLRDIGENYFRVRFIGFDEPDEPNNPDRPLIYFSNHSGMTFPWDAIMFSSGFMQLNKFEFKRFARALVAPPLVQLRLVNAFLVKDFWKRAGGIAATTLNFETMMQFNDAQVLIYPEGVPGIAKGFNHKYELQRFATSFIRMSIKYKTDIIPICTVNGEYINPYSYASKTVNKVANMLGIPFLPVSWLLLFLPFFPWLFYFAFPARLTYVKGKRMSPWKWVDKPFEELGRDEIEAVRDRVQAQMQKDLNEAVEKYGKDPYDGWSLFKFNLSHFKKFPFFNSPTWPVLFLEHERLYRKKAGRPFKIRTHLGALFMALIKNPFALVFFIPILGWIPLLIRGYKK